MDRQHMPALDSQMARSGHSEIYLPVSPPRISHASRREQKKDWQVYGNLPERTAARSKRENRVVNRRSKIPQKLIGSRSIIFAQCHFLSLFGASTCNRSALLPSLTRSFPH